MKIPTTMSRKDYEYLLGAYLGDGTPYNNHGIKMTTANDGYTSVIAEIMKPLKPRVVREKDTYSRVIAGLAENSIAEFFVPYKKDYRWHVPQLEYPKEFIAGVFDTDGSIRERGWTAKDTYEIMLYQKTYENLVDLGELLEPMYIYPALRRVGREDYPMYYLDITHPTQMRIFAEQIPSRYPRKAKLLDECKRYSPNYAEKHRD